MLLSLRSTINGTKDKELVKMMGACERLYMNKSFMYLNDDIFILKAVYQIL